MLRRADTDGAADTLTCAQVWEQEGGALVRGPVRLRRHLSRGAQVEPPEPHRDAQTEAPRSPPRSHEALLQESGALSTSA